MVLYVLVPTREMGHFQGYLFKITKKSIATEHHFNFRYLSIQISSLHARTDIFNKELLKVINRHEIESRFILSAPGYSTQTRNSKQNRRARKPPLSMHIYLLTFFSMNRWDAWL